MFLEAEILNEGKVVTNNTKTAKIRHSEGKSPKSYSIDAKQSGYKSTKSQACVNSNWEKLRR